MAVDPVVLFVRELGDGVGDGGVEIAEDGPGRRAVVDILHHGQYCMEEQDGYQGTCEHFVAPEEVVALLIHDDGIRGPSRRHATPARELIALVRIVERHPDELAG